MVNKIKLINNRVLKSFCLKSSWLKTSQKNQIKNPINKYVSLVKQARPSAIPAKIHLKGRSYVKIKKAEITNKKLVRFSDNKATEYTDSNGEIIINKNIQGEALG